VRNLRSEVESYLDTVGHEDDANRIASLVADSLKSISDVDEKWQFVFKNIAPFIANRYACEPRLTRNNTVTFYTYEGLRHDTALTTLRVILAQTGLIALSGHQARKARPKSRLQIAIEAFDNLPLSERKIFLTKIHQK
jgi:hypothetical protein